jgi:hypothetical protein
MAGPQLVVKPLQMAIPFNVSLLLPEAAARHPLRDALVDAIRASAGHLQARMGGNRP